MDYFNKIISTAKRKRRDYEVLEDCETNNGIDNG